MDCRLHRGAYCIAPPISSLTPGIPNGKPADVRYAQLNDADGCWIFGQPERPAVCGSLQPAPDMYGDSATHAMQFLTRLELVIATH